MSSLPLADRVMRARRESPCALCTDPVRTGQWIARCGGTWYHVACVVRQITERRSAATGDL